MPENVAIDGIECTVVGWGIAETRQIAQILQYTVTKVLNDSYCFKNDPPITAVSSENTFCGGEGSGTPSQGDSGGGIFAMYNNSWVQYGIVSAIRTNETGHALPNSYAVYTNIQKFKNWIINTAKMNMNITLTCHHISKYFMAK